MSTAPAHTHAIPLTSLARAQVIASEKWDRPYSREKAAFPVPWLRDAKLWPFVGRVDDTFGLTRHT